MHPPPGQVRSGAVPPEKVLEEPPNRCGPAARFRCTGLLECIGRETVLLVWIGDRERNGDILALKPCGPALWTP